MFTLGQKFLDSLQIRFTVYTNEHESDTKLSQSMNPQHSNRERFLETSYPRKFQKLLQNTSRANVFCKEFE